MQAIRSVSVCGILFSGLLLFLACNKTIQNPQSFPVHPVPAFDTLHDLRHMIDSLPNSGLFLLALQRTGYDTLLRRKDSVYTILVPTDSLLISMGYTRDVITYLNPGLLLTGIISPQFLYGDFSDSLLNASGYIGASSKVDPATQVRYTYRLGKQAGPAGGLWIYGVPISARTYGLRSSNGYLYSVNKYYQPSVVNGWTLLQSKPEFSYFVAACQINDSLYTALGSQYRQQSYFAPNDTDIVNGGYNMTCFVPTNQAFINAGFRTVDDIRTFALTAVYDPANATVSPLDSIIYGHCMTDSAIMTFDLRRSPGFNLRPLVSTLALPSGGYAVYDKFKYQSILYNIGFSVNNDPYNFPAQYGRSQPYLGKLFFQTSGNAVGLTCNSTRNPPPAMIVEPDMVCANNLILQGVDHLLWPY